MLKALASAATAASVATTLLATTVAAAQETKLRPSFLVTSPTYPEFASIDRRSAASERDCGGQNLSPALAWSGEPSRTQSFAVYFQDPDGMFGQGEAKWIGYNIPSSVHALAEGAMSGSTPGVTVGLNEHDESAYYGPCPPYGTMHHYVYGVYALDLPVGSLKPGLNKIDFLKALKGHVVAYQSIVFAYQRPLPANGVIPAWTPRQPRKAPSGSPSEP